jgi:hypothetical protein
MYSDRLKTFVERGKEFYTIIRYASLVDPNYRKEYLEKRISKEFCKEIGLKGPMHKIIDDILDGLRRRGKFVGYARRHYGD